MYFSMYQAEKEAQIRPVEIRQEASKLSVQRICILINKLKELKNLLKSESEKKEAATLSLQHLLKGI